MSTGNDSYSSTIANIALPSQNLPSLANATHAQANVVASTVPTAQAGQYDYYSTPEYQQYYQQYYANAYNQQQTAAAYAQQQQYAAYYSATGSADPSSTALYSAMYGQGAYLAQPGTTTPTTTANGTSADHGEEYDDEEDDDPTIAKSKTKLSNTLPYHCNSKMGLNPLIYTNIQQSPYFKNNLFQLKTYHEVVDEIYYHVRHMEPWEQGSRKVSGQTGMCGSVRGVGAGGIISTPFCILFKLYTLRLTRKQVNGLIRHKDSPYIRGLGFMYIRYTQPPQDLWQWFEPFLDDQEEIDPKAGGGSSMTIGDLVRCFLTKPDWFSTLFPRIPIPVQKDIEEKLHQYDSFNDGTSSSNEKSYDDHKSDGNYKKQSYRKESKYSNNDSSRQRRSRSRSPANYHGKRTKQDDGDRSNRHKKDRYY